MPITLWPIKNGAPFCYRKRSFHFGIYGAPRLYVVLCFFTCFVCFVHESIAFLARGFNFFFFVFVGHWSNKHRVWQCDIKAQLLSSIVLLIKPWVLATTIYFNKLEKNLVDSHFNVFVVVWPCFGWGTFG